MSTHTKTLKRSPVTYRLEAGRVVMRDGEQFVTINGVRPYDPCDVDEFARSLISTLNSHAALVEACEAALTAWHDQPSNLYKKEPAWVPQLRAALALAGKE